MDSEGECLDANVDYGTVGGYFVRVDVELPADAVSTRTREDGGPTGWLDLSPKDAESLAARLLTAAKRVRDQQATA
jgi:predicted aspartyl protease